MPESDAKNTDIYTIDLRELLQRLLRGLPVTLGLTLLLGVVGAVIQMTVSPLKEITTNARVVFSFSGYEAGLNPDKSNFSFEDLRAPEIIAEALDRLSIDSNVDRQSKVRSAITIKGIIAPSVLTARDQLRASGQPVPPFFPDEYSISLTLPRKYDLTVAQREEFLTEIVSVYLQRFKQTYVDIPLTLGSAFGNLQETDYFDYELVLNREAESIGDYLSQMHENAPSFRSPQTNLTFGDLLKDSELFNHIHLNETLGLIRQYGLSTDRSIAMLKMDYYLQALEDREARAIENETLVMRLLEQTRESSPSHILGTKSQADETRPSTTIDQGLIDSLLENDAYNFLVREALDAGLETRAIQSEKAILQERRSSMKAFIESESTVQTEAIARLEDSLVSLREAYDRLVASIRQTHEDYQRQRFANAVRISKTPTTESVYRPILIAAFIGAALGLFAGAGMSLLGFGFGRSAEQAT